MKTAILSLIISLAVATLSIFQFERYQKLSDELNMKLSSFEKIINDKITNINQTQAKQEEQIKVIGSKINATNIDNITLPQNSELNSKVQIKNLNDNQSLEHFKILQAYYFTELAQNKLQTSYDIEGARRLLSKAKEELQKINNPAVIEISDQINKKMDELLAINLPNVNEIWSTINTLNEKINTLPTKGLRLNAKDELTEKKLNTQSNEKISWRNTLDKVWEDIKDLIKIQRHSKPIDPILSKEEQLLAQEHLRLLLEQIRWALLHNNQLVYERSMKETIEWINTYFEINDPQVKNFEQALIVLTKLNVKPNIPDLNPILQSFAEIKDNP